MTTSAQTQAINATGKIQLNQSSAFGDLSAFLATSSLSNFDQQIKSMTEKMKSIMAEKEDVSSDKSVLTAFQSGKTVLTESNNIYPVAVPKKSVLTGDFIKMSSKQLDDFKELSNKYGVTLSKDDYGLAKNIYYISSAQVDAVLEKAESKLETLNSTSEIKMIKFQSLMDSRKQALLMLSNLFSGQNSTMMGIIQNLKS